MLGRKRQGASFRQISAELGVSRTKVQKLFSEGMRDADGLTVDTLRRLMLERLEYVGMLAYAKMVGVGGCDLDIDGFRAWMATMAQIMKLTGLDQGPPGDGPFAIASEWAEHGDNPAWVHRKLIDLLDDSIASRNEQREIG